MDSKEGLLSTARTLARLSPAARRRIREQAGLSQHELARVLGVAVSSVCRWETYVRRPRGEPGIHYARLLRDLEDEAAS